MRTKKPSAPKPPARKRAPRKAKPNGAAGHDTQGWGVGQETASAPAVTHPSNGGLPETHTQPVPEKVPVGEAMRLAVLELGSRLTEEPITVGQAAQLADCVEEIARRRAAHTIKAEEAKTAKKSLDVALEQLELLAKTFTHAGADLPLFDAKEREGDLEAMTTAGIDNHASA